MRNKLHSTYLRNEYQQLIFLLKNRYLDDFRLTTVNLRFICCALFSIFLHLHIGSWLPPVANQNWPERSPRITQVVLINPPPTQLLPSPDLDTARRDDNPISVKKKDIAAPLRKSRAIIPKITFPKKNTTRQQLPMRNLSTKKSRVKTQLPLLTAIPPATQTISASNHNNTISATLNNQTNNSAEDNLPVIPPVFNAAYLHNSPPEYPLIARQNGWEGVVKLKVWVSEKGSAERIDIQRSSGYELLDHAARTAVQNWRFIPARRGNSLIASVIITPLEFRLDH